MHLTRREQERLDAMRDVVFEGQTDLLDEIASDVASGNNIAGEKVMDRNSNDTPSDH